MTRSIKVARRWRYPCRVHELWVGDRKIAGWLHPPTEAMVDWAIAQDRARKAGGMPWIDAGGNFNNRAKIPFKRRGNQHAKGGRPRKARAA